MPPLSCSRKPQTIVQATSDTTTGEKNSVRKTRDAAQLLVEQHRQQQRQAQVERPPARPRTAPVAASTAGSFGSSSSCW